MKKNWIATEEAIAFGESGRWKELTPEEHGLITLRQELLCMDVAAAFGGLSALLGRPVYTHEMADPDTLWAEYQGTAPKPDMVAILAKLDQIISRRADR